MSDDQAREAARRWLWQNQGRVNLLPEDNDRIANGVVSAFLAARADDESKQERTIQRIREALRPLGYAVAVHGSRARDLDLIAAPWVEDAKPLQAVLDALEAAEFIYSPAEHRAHGRVAFCVHGVAGALYVDLSVMPPSAVPESKGVWPSLPREHWQDGRPCSVCGGTGGESVQSDDQLRDEDATAILAALPRTNNRAYDLRQRVDRAVRWLRDAEDIARLEMPAWSTADRIRDIYEQITDDILNGRESVPPLREREEAAQLAVLQLAARVAELEACERPLREALERLRACVANLQPPDDAHEIWTHGFLVACQSIAAIIDQWPAALAALDPKREEADE